MASFDMIVMLKLPYIPGCVEWVFKVSWQAHKLLDRVRSAPLARCQTCQKCKAVE